MERKFAHSERVVFPRMTAPAARSFAAIVASCAGAVPTSAIDPAVVCIRSCVSMLSLSRTGMPWSGPRTCPARRSASSDRAMSSASGLSSMIELSDGSMRLMRARYAFTSERAVRSRFAIDVWSWAIVAS